jgi:Protein of unknown function (DUF2723)
LRRAWPAVVLGAVYFCCASRWALGGDDSEFATLFTEGGVAHPPGYPAYVLWLRAWSWLPGVTPAMGAAWATGLLGVLAAVMLYRAARAWGASGGAALCAVGIYALSPLALRFSTEAEVFAGHALLCATVLRLAARAPLSFRAPLLGVVFGLGAVHQLTLALLAPLGVVALGREPRRARSLALAVVGFAGGLLPAAYLVWTSAHRGDRWVWGHAETLAGLLQHMRRADYGTLSLDPRVGAREPLAQWSALLVSAGLGLLVVPALTALVVLARAAAGRVRGISRADAFAWWIALVLSGPLLVALVNVAPRGLGLHIVHKLHLMFELLLVVPAALGLDWLARRLPRASRFAGAALLMLAAAASVPRVVDAHRPTVERWARDTLTGLPANAVLLGTGDHRTFALLYAQRALGLRPDVICINPLLLHYDWYRDRAAARLQRTLPAPAHGSVDTRSLAQAVLDAGRPLFLTDSFSAAIPTTFTHFPIGPVIRVLPPGANPPTVDELEALNLARVKDLALLDEPPPAPDSFAALVRADYARPFRELAALPGDPERAARNRARAAAMAP